MSQTSVSDTHFPCTACGADLRYAPGSDQLVCDHCGNEEPIESGPWRQSALRELDFQAAVANQLPAEDIEVSQVLDCPNCKAQVAFEPDTHAAECPFCATPVVTDTGEHRHIKPHGQMPFTLDEKAARKAMNTWLGRLWFAPSGLKEYARAGRQLQGIYVPFWTYDARTKSNYTGRRGTVYYVSRTKTVTVNGKSQTKQVREKKIRWKDVSGRVARNFDDILVLGAQSLPKDDTDALAPWDLSHMEPYRPEYLAGFRAEGYTVPLEEGYTEARDIMDRTIARDVKFDIGGDRQKIKSVDTDVSGVTFKHILLPIWIAAYKYRGRSFRFVVNAQTGRVRGERPYSAWKITFAVLAALIVAAVAGYFIAMNQ